MQSKLTPQSSQILSTPCILWTASRNIKTKNRLDYGQVKVGGKMKKAHRVAWEKVNGEIPKGMLVLHKCDVPYCVNTDHLYLGTHSDNAKDREKRGRGRPLHGENNVNKISEMTAVRLKMIGKSMNMSKLARALGISPSQVCSVINGKSWKHVTANTRYTF